MNRAVPGHGQHAGSPVILGIAEHPVAVLHQLPPSLLDALPLHLHVGLVVLRQAVRRAPPVYDGATVPHMRSVQHLRTTCTTVGAYTVPCTYLAEAF